MRAEAGAVAGINTVAIAVSAVAGLGALCLNLECGVACRDPSQNRSSMTHTINRQVLNAHTMQRGILKRHMLDSRGVKVVLPSHPALQARKERCFYGPCRTQKGRD